MSLKCPACRTILTDDNSLCERCGVKGEQCEDVSVEAKGARKIESQCSDLDVFCNVSRIFVEGSILPFDFRIRPLVDGITDLCIELETANIPRLTETFDEYLEKDSEYESYISFTPPKGCNGLLPFRIYIGYKKDEETLWFIAREKHKIYKSDEPANKVVENLKIELNANIGQGQASDGIQQRLDGLQSLVPSTLDPAAALQKVDLPPDWKLLPLRKCHPQRKLGKVNPAITLEKPSQSALVWRVTLQNSSGITFHLLGRPALQLGRSRECDVVTRIMDVDGSADRQANSKISRCHCHIQNRGVNCCIDDIGFSTKKNEHKPSAYGTYLNDSRVKTGQNAILPMDSKFSLSLAGRCDDPDSIAFNCKVYSSHTMGALRPDICQASESTSACMTLERQDGLPEVFVLLWEYCDMQVLRRELNVDLPDLFIFRNEGAFAYMNINNQLDRNWLVPGDTVHGLKVTTFRQLGKWAESV